MIHPHPLASVAETIANAAKQFRWYADNHAAKHTAEGDEKAHVNLMEAVKLEKALALVNQMMVADMKSADAWAEELGKLFIAAGFQKDDWRSIFSPMFLQVQQNSYAAGLAALKKVKP